jgi:hypothetical protein
VAENPPEKHGYNVIERKCRIVFDVNIRISEITPESVAGYFTPDESGEGLPWEWAERQNRFLLALLQDVAALDQFLTNIAIGDFGFLLESKQIGGLSDDEEDALFEKVFAGMSDDDRVFFQGAKNDGILYHNIELVHKAFVTDWKRAKIINVYQIKGREREDK